jgi:hypothetical protein
MTTRLLGGVSGRCQIRAEWQYINLRRVFMMIEESIDVGTQWVVFEPNDQPLQTLGRR